MLEVQKYLRSGKTLVDLEEQYGIEYRIKNHKVSLNYSQLNSPKGERICQECRGLILRDDTWDIVAFPFTRFFNYGEMDSHNRIDWKSVKVLEKIDGCLHGDAVISTENGPISIKDICEKKLNVKVVSVDIETMEYVLDEIVGFSIKSNIDDWYEIECENGQTVILTGSHRVYVPSLHCYRCVRDLCGNEDFFLEK